MEFNHLKNTINYIIEVINKYEKIIIDVNRALDSSDEYKFDATLGGEKYYGSLEDFGEEIYKAIIYHKLIKKEMETEFITRIMEKNND